jgi:glycosyltransferase involved in cell wall biosynthesis
VIDRTGVRPYIEFMGQVPHAAALGLMRESHAALLIQAPDDDIHIPGKLFEAMGGRVPLLAVAHPCEVTDIIQRCQAGIVCPHSADGVAAALEEFHRRFRQGLAWEFDEEQVNRFSADTSVARLANLFERARS